MGWLDFCDINQPHKPPAFKLKQQKKNSRNVLFFRFAWQRPTLTGGNPQLPSALRSLTSVF
uniref:hypothetical protein n=1 Tax=Mesobacillus zeae TaxID=1917180 RepID=UPI001C628839